MPDQSSLRGTCGSAGGTIGITLGLAFIGMVIGGMGGILLGSLINYLVPQNTNKPHYIVLIGVIGLIIGTITFGVVGYSYGKQGFMFADAILGSKWLNWALRIFGLIATIYFCYVTRLIYWGYDPLPSLGFLWCLSGFVFVVYGFLYLLTLTRRRS